jgi:hypothetical protein
MTSRGTSLRADSTDSVALLPRGTRGCAARGGRPSAFCDSGASRPRGAGPANDDVRAHAMFRLLGKQAFLTRRVSAESYDERPSTRLRWPAVIGGSLRTRSEESQEAGRPTRTSGRRPRVPTVTAGGSARRGSPRAHPSLLVPRWHPSESSCRRSRPSGRGSAAAAR